MIKRLVAVSLLLFPILGNAEGLPDKKEGIVEFCSACHGVNGVSTLDHIPNLWGQSDQYLREQIENFRSKKRHTTFMDAFIYQISDEQMDTIVKHYSSVPDALTFDLQWRGDKWPGDMSLGEKIAFSGKMEANIPACVACHGPSGVGVKPSFPRLAGQNSAYLVNQMKSWKNDTRPAGMMDLMAPIAKGLTDQEIQAVSEYFASLGKVEDKAANKVTANTAQGAKQ